MRPADEDSFVAFVEASSPRLLRLAWLTCGDPHLAQELLQETYERVYVKWGKASVANPTAYTRRVLMNLTTDRWRRRRKETLSIDGTLPEVAGADEHGRAEDRDLLMRLLRALPPRERQIVVLRHYDDLSEREVADALGISLGTVKSSTSRGLATMRAALTQMQEA
ncbi:SigE family RNA polymerase sigma factor [Luteipulveratus mongoliensis]|uniref:RNA polymerase n=1 Tax=Luteipulveratus mongoliensis TaxID=571913 RepID=A0A0K1JI31_9MICO|nr:SigE family RNA polymerase sigma factor [Luteipulveratus mongoliensis]AKU16238.1 hypothetical protein VV02_10805 [Luteipulveratus mongoliensis]